MYSPHPQTIVFIICFFLIFIGFLLRKTAKNSLDFYDFISLSSVATIPLIFAIAPQVSIKISQLIGVEYPFILMFGLLMSILFMYQVYLVSRIRKLQKQVITLTQEISLSKISRK